MSSLLCWWRRVPTTVETLSFLRRTSGEPPSERGRRPVAPKTAGSRWTQTSPDRYPHHTSLPTTSASLFNRRQTFTANIRRQDRLSSAQSSGGGGGGGRLEESVLLCPRSLQSLQSLHTLQALVPSLLRHEVETALEKLDLIWDRTYAWDVFVDMMVRPEKNLRTLCAG